MFNMMFDECDGEVEAEVTFEFLCNQTSPVYPCDINDGLFFEWNALYPNHFPWEWPDLFEGFLKDKWPDSGITDLNIKVVKITKNEC